MRTISQESTATRARYATRVVLPAILLTVLAVELSPSTAQERRMTFRLKSLALGQAPHSIELGDLNADGYLDIATANGGHRSLTVLINQTDGRFSAPTRYEVENVGHLNTLTLADLDRDGNTDVVTADLFDDRVLIFRNRGDGQLLSPTSHVVGRSPFLVKSSDLDGDGRLDLISANQLSDTVSILHNVSGVEGEIAFERREDIRVGSTPVSVTTLDLDGDGDVDLAVANSTSSYVSVLSNVGGGMFSEPRKTAVLHRPTSIVAADFNGDGREDLAVANGPNVSILLNKGKQGLERVLRDTVAQHLSWALAVADINDDGFADMVSVSQNENNVSILIGSGNGTFEQPILQAVGVAPPAVAVGDLDNDGDVDIVTANRSSQDVTLLLNEQELGPEILFIRGDADASGRIDINDPIRGLLFQFGGTVTPCLDALDWDDNGVVEVADAIGSLTHQFLGGLDAQPPGSVSCGADQTNDELTCETFEPCL